MAANRLLTYVAATLTLSAAVAQVPPTHGQSPTVATYDMTVEVRPQDRTVQGGQRIRWRNTSKAPVTDLQFHLYWNAFRDLRSTFMRESDKDFRSQWRDGDFGGIDVERIALVGTGGEQELTLGFLQPDDGNSDDATVLGAALPQAVQPDQEITIVTRFRAVMPKALRRTGWIPGGGVYLMHWYPILGVLQDDAGGSKWNCHQFHAHTEFFADFSTYRVAITLPGDYVIGATGGVPSSSTDAGEGRTTHVFDQADVHNFAMVADRDFVRHTETFGPIRAAEDRTGVCAAVAARMGVPVETFDLPATEILLLLHKEHDTSAHRSRHLEATKVALEFFGLRYGPYPYRSITVVDPGRDARGRSLGGGMEYPTLITCGTPLFLHGREPSPEGVTVHEFGHQYWYGLSANNEFEEAWLDEGINTYSEGRAQWIAYRPDRRSSHGRDVIPAEVHRAALLLPLAVSRGPWIAPDGLALRRDLPGAWRVPGFRRARALGFEANWTPRSPILDLMRTQSAATWHGGVTHQDVFRDRQRFLDAATPDAMVMPGWLHVNRASYSANSYTRPATLLRTLERMVPGDVWWAFLREFHAQARFRHPTTTDFVTLLEARCGAGAAEYFRGAIQAGATFDYGVHSVKTEAGRTLVTIRRKGIMTADVKVRFTFERGAPEARTLAAADAGPIWRFDFEDADNGDRGRLVEVWVDPPELHPDQEERAWPAGVHLLDANLLDNAWRLRVDPAPARHRALRALFQAQCELSFTGLIG